MRIVEEVLFLQATYTLKTEKQTISSLILCQFDAGMLAEGRGHETPGEFTSLSVSLQHFGWLLAYVSCVIY